MISPTVWCKPADGRKFIEPELCLYKEQGCVNIMCKVALVYSADEGKQTNLPFPVDFIEVR